jgi:cytochrome c oxidase cbb3-type subunit III
MMPFLSKSKKGIGLIAILMLTGLFQPTWAAGRPVPSVFDNSLAITLIILMIILLIVIAVLGNIVIGAADFKTKKLKQLPVASITTISVLLVLCSDSAFAQGPVSTAPIASLSKNIGGLSPSTFYIMASVIFLELTVILVLLANVRALLKVEKAKLAETKVLTVQETKNKLSWWDRFNKLRPVTQEADLDLGHEYDGIRELNNRLPPWWLYGFYLTIVIAAIYLWRYHVSHSAPSSQQEYEYAVAKGDQEVEQYLKLKGDNVDENNVALLTGSADIEAGKAIFTNPANCVPCHRADAGGVVGPNLTDDYWIYGGNIKDIFKTIKYGTNKGMRSWKDDLSAKQINQVASYIKSIHGTNPPNPKEQQGDLYKEELTSQPVADTARMMTDSIKSKDNKVARN